MPRSSRALVLERFGELPRLVSRPVPDRPPGHTLVRVRAAQISHLDLNIVDGQFGILPELPAVPGTEAAGVVVASDVHPEGMEVRIRGGGVGLKRDGGWAEHALVRDEVVVPVPPGTDPALACCFFSPAGTAQAAVHRVAAIQPGERVAVTGAAGAVGALTVQLAARAGAKVFGVVGRRAKLGSVPPPAKPLLVSELTADAVGAPLDAVIDTVGGPVLATALGLVRGRGRVALVGYTAGRELRLDLADFLLADVSLLPVNLMTRGEEVMADADRLLTELNAGELTLPIERYPLDRLDEAAGRLRSGEAVGKVVLEFD
ncbi:quinone oxidoreductase family protein [Nonomuraea gerenzanensis]|uniref:Alcohol dehydrogenase, zinc-binding domain protein n=1 Tax=Nonomuraea gerenzanensis TaxID=93944 RepID=A0A1M4E9S2_9ACTN|nr:zinc-binding alcohol dehydrogenase family protein [Nonomuraea gerenzanensis]UBU18904.1 zinc-binding alcohol dehydrogenase family protein [Nonomuraea gerenzanensis]SBO95605.1 Alcohol dehydrogenase, zinc-binding domain protein [Nonomuraea gerenzanensis]